MGANQIHDNRIASTQPLLIASYAEITSPPLPPLPPSLYIRLTVDVRDDILSLEQPHSAEVVFVPIMARIRVGESSTTRPIRGRGIDYGFVSMVDAEERRYGIIDVGYGIRDTWVDPVEDGRSRISHRVDMDSQRVDLLMGDRMTLQEIELRPIVINVYDRGPISRHTMKVQACKSTLIQTHSQADFISTAREAEVELDSHGPDARIPCFTRILSGDVTVTSCVLLSTFELQGDLNFKGTEGVVCLTWWIEKMESVFNISGCAIENQVKFATCTLLGVALTWWNGQIRTLGPEAYAVTWEVLKKKMTDKYCLQEEINKLEIELWNLKVKGNDVPAYTECFQELTLICTKFVANETEKVDKYISGLPDNIYGNVKSARPKTLDETIELANDLMDQKLRTYAERQSDHKRKADDSSRNNHGHQQQPFKRQNVAK
ncbi:reverse transcriptase domain-containing protein, partial [Tanacetum coccineum]